MRTPVLLLAIGAFSTCSCASKGPAEPTINPRPELPSCPTFAQGVSRGVVDNPAVSEASGVVESRKNPGVLWVHNDSGDKPRVFALSTTGKTLGEYSLQGAAARDWEDLAIGPGPTPGETYLYLADIGDNRLSRSDYKVYRVVEPQVGTSPATLTGVEVVALEYPDGSHNAETLLIDPVGGDLYIVTKSKDGITPVYRASAPMKTNAANVLEKVITLQFGAGELKGGTTATAGEISPSGDEIAVRTYGSAYLWRRRALASVAEALATPPCRIPVQSEAQGEAIGFAADASGYYTISEGRAAPIYFFARQ